MRKRKHSTPLDPYWIPWLARITLPAHQRLRDIVDHDNALGFPRHALHSRGLRELLAEKEKHPTCILFTRNGEFYDHAGIDALMCMQYAGLNQTGSALKTGCPMAKLQYTLDKLVAVGFTCCVYEQVRRKSGAGYTRYLTQLVDAQQPTYLHAPEQRTLTHHVRVAQPVVGVYKHSQCTLCVFSPNARTCATMDGVPAVAAKAYIDHLGPSAIWGTRQWPGGRALKYSGPAPDFPAFFMRKVLAAYGFPDDMHVNHTRVAMRNRPRPLYTFTAAELGLGERRSDHVASLARCALADDAPKACRQLVRQWLLMPPPRPVAATIHEALGLVCDATLPTIHVYAPAKYVPLLGTGRPHAQVFHDMMALLASVSRLRRDHPDLTRACYAVAQHETGLATTRDTWANVGNALHTYLDERLVDQDMYAHAVPPALAAMRERLEAGYGHVRLTHLADEWAAQSAALDAYASMMTSRAVFRAREQRIVMRGPMGPSWKPARDSKGKVIKGHYTCEDLDVCHEAYLAALAALKTKHDAMLDQMCRKVYPKTMPVLLLSSSVQRICKTLYDHARHVMPRGWTLHTTVGADTCHLTGAFPYWKHPTGAVRNTVTVDGMTLLFGPNMGGKSTLIRTVCATALLATCGLFVPAAEARVPHFDSFFMRMSSYDKPSENQSAFAVEMHDLRIMFEDLSPHSLICVDEIGCGTSNQDSHALSLAVLEHLRGHRGFFATHLHHLASEPRLRDVTKKHMHYTLHEDALTYHYVLADGPCHESLAYYTAKACGLPATILRSMRRVQQEAAREAVHTLAHRAMAQHCDALARPLHVGADEEPPPSLTTASVVYVLAWGGLVYVGETDNMVTRLKAHRKDKAGCEAWIWRVGNKSQARRLETVTGQYLHAHGVTLSSCHDNAHVSFGGGL